MLFPNVFAKIEEAGIDPRKELVPIAPAAHYTMGGIVTDINARSTVPGLLAVGECSCTGLHGANRLASNSLAECMVFGRRAALSALAEESPLAGDAATASPPAKCAAAEYSPDPDPAATRELLWSCAGIERTAEGLEQPREQREPACPADRRQLAGPRRDARRAPPQRLPRDRPRARLPALRFDADDDAPVAHRWE